MEAWFIASSLPKIKMNFNFSAFYLHTTILLTCEGVKGQLQFQLERENVKILLSLIYLVTP